MNDEFTVIDNTAANNTITFNTTNGVGEPILTFTGDNKVLYKGKEISDDAELIKGLKEWLTEHTKNYVHKDRIRELLK